MVSESTFKYRDLLATIGVLLFAAFSVATYSIPIITPEELPSPSLFSTLIEVMYASFATPY